MQTSPDLNSEDKLWAAIAHGSALVPLWGGIVAAIIWFTQRNRSAFVRFHSLQALSYQMIALWAFTWLWPVVMIGISILVILGTLLLGPESLDSERAGLAFSVGIQLVIWGSMLGVFGLYALVGLLAAGASISGREFRYPVIGRALARKLDYSGADSAISEAHEDQVVGAIAHSTAILLILGAIVPLVVWLTQKDRSRFLAFQSLQAAIFQGLGALGYFAGLAFYLLSVAAFFGFGLSGALEPGSAPKFTALLLMIVPLLCFVLLILIGGPLFHLFALIASLRVLRGHDYNYPLLGRYLRRPFQASSEAKTEGSS